MNKFIDKHMSLIVAIGIALLVFVGFMILKGIFFPSEAKAIYGTRLEGRDKVKITEEKKEHIKTKLSEGTTSVTVRIAGRIIYVDIKLDGNVGVDAAKAMGNTALGELTDAEKAYYDVQFIIENDANEKQFPIIGYKHHTKTAISWTKDR